MGKREWVPRVFEYSDFRSFLQAVYEEGKSLEPPISLHRLAQWAGYKGRASFLLVVSGRRGMSPEQADHLGRNLGLDEQERAYLVALVRKAALERRRRQLTEEILAAESPLEANRAALRAQALDRQSAELEHSIVALQRHHRARRHDGFAYLSSWLYVAIREMVEFPDFRPDPAWIRRRLRFPVEDDEIRRALEELPKLGVVTVDEDGRWGYGPELDQIVFGHEVHPVVAANEAHHLAVKNYHRQVLELAQGSIDRIPSEERHLNTRTFRGSARQFERLRAAIIALIEQATDAADDEPADTIYQIHASLFPLTRATEDEGKR